MDILLRNRSERNLQSSRRQSPSNCNMMTIKGAYTLVHATSENAGNLLISMLRYGTKSGGTENPREAGPILLSEIQLIQLIQNHLSDVGSQGYWNLYQPLGPKAGKYPG